MDSCRIAGGLAVLFWALAGGLASGQTLSRVSLTGNGAEANGNSAQSSVSADGRFVAFASAATNLVGNDTNGVADIFVKDRQTGVITRVSVRSDGSQADGTSVAPSISADGRFVAFVSSAALVAEDNNGPCSAGQALLPTCADIYVHDRQTGETTRVSVASDNTQADNQSGHPHISGDGRYVVFDSSATNLVPGDTDLDSDVFVRDRLTGTTTRVSVTTSGIQAEHAAYLPTISDDGQVVLFISRSTNLDGAPDTLPCAGGVPCQRLFIHTMANGVTTRANIVGLVRPKVTSVEVGSANQEIGAAISRDGTTILASVVTTYGDPVPDPSYGTFLVSPVAGDAVAYTIATQQTRVLDTVDLTGLLSFNDGISALTVDAHGRTFAFCATGVSAGEYTSLRVVDTLTGTSLRVPPDNSGLDFCAGTSLNAGGTLLTFATNSPLVSGDTNPSSDVFALGLFTRYLAEGVINSFFSTYINVFNPADTPALVHGRYLGQNGNVTTSDQIIPPHLSAALNIVPPDQSFSTVVESDTFLAIERTVAWPSGAGAFYGAHAEAAIDRPRTTWYFAEGATHGQFDLFYLLQNPGATDTSATITYLRPAPQPTIVRTYTVPAHSRLTIWVDQEPGLDATDVSATIQSTDPILAERSMYLTTPDQAFAGGIGGAGIAAPATQWFVAEGATGGFFDLFYLIGNPSAQDTTVTVTYLLPDGSSFDKSYPVAGLSRLTINVDGEDPRLAGTSVSAVIKSANAPIIVERSMWWPSPVWYEGHLTAATTETGTRWALAQGTIDSRGDHETYLLIANPGDTAANVTIDIHGLDSDGQSTQTLGCTRSVPLAAHSRYSTGIKDFCGITSTLGTVNMAGTIISDGPGIVAERSTYWSANGQFWASGSSTLLTRLP